MKWEDFIKTNHVWGWVEEDGTYAFREFPLSRLIAGDTDSCMLSLEGIIDKDESVDNVCHLADELAGIVNSSFPEFVKQAFNCPEERKHTIQTDREIVSDKSLFLTKKRYIMHMVDKEGERVDKKKIMGVELKKSDTSDAAKEILSELVDMMLDNIPKEEIREHVKELKRTFSQRPLKTIARPISVKGLRKYEGIYRVEGSMKGFPYQVRGAMYYNSLCSSSDKPIGPSDKIGVLNIKDPNYNHIAFPIDREHLPDFMKTLVYDYDVMWNATYKKIESYLSSIGFDIQGLKDTKKRELFGF
jgi:DNA polymerase elongation subunit (family B)